MPEQETTDNNPTEATQEAEVTTDTAATDGAQETSSNDSPAEAGSNDEPVTAASRFLADDNGGDDKQPADKSADKSSEPKDESIDLNEISDDDYAKAVVPTEDGTDEEPDRSLITAMAADLRTAGISPKVMQPIAKIFDKVIRDIHNKQAEERKASMMAKAKACNEAVSEETWKDFARACKEYIKGKPNLEYVIAHTELGSDPDFIDLIAKLGVPLRVERGTSATVAARSSRDDLERAVFEQTVPKHLRR